MQYLEVNWWYPYCTDYCIQSTQKQELKDNFTAPNCIFKIGQSGNGDVIKSSTTIHGI